MAVRVGLILSLLVVVGAIAYATRPGRVGNRYPDLAYIDVYLALMGAVVALAIIWLGVLVATALSRKRTR